MCNRWDLCFSLFTDREDLFHEGHGFIQLKPIGYMLTQDEGRKGAETLAALDFGIQQILGIRPAGVHDDATPAQSARTEFGPSIEPADDLAVHQGV